MKVALVFFLMIFSLACNKSAPPVVNSTKPINAAQQTNEAKSVLSHSGENGTPKPANSGARPGASGDPIDTAKFDEQIAKAEKAMKAKSDDASKGLLAEAYFERGFALTEARQYASALGDYRRALKFDPNHAESKKWIVQIVDIYKMLKKEAPKEGEEPAPLPFKKQA